MKMQDDKDKSLRELFEADRRVDRATAPPFERVPPARPISGRGFSRTARLIVATAGVGAMAMALWTLREADAPAPVTPDSDVETAPPVARLDPETAASQPADSIPGGGEKKDAVIAALEAKSESPDKGLSGGERSQDEGRATPPPEPMNLVSAGEPNGDPRLESQPAGRDDENAAAPTAVIATGAVAETPAAEMPIEHPAVAADVQPIIAQPAPKPASPVSRPKPAQRGKGRAGSGLDQKTGRTASPDPAERWAAVQDLVRQNDSGLSTSGATAFVGEDRRFQTREQALDAYRKLNEAYEGMSPSERADVHRTVREMARNLTPEDRNRVEAALTLWKEAGERYTVIEETGFMRALDHPLSTFSVDVDTASYTKARKTLREGRRPPADSIRIEEWINFFDYDLPEPRGNDPFAVTVEIAGCPWQPDHRLARVALQGRKTTHAREAGANLVFLVDVSGSMNAPDKAPLVQETLREAARSLRGGDWVSIVTYAGQTEIVLEPTSGDDQAAIHAAIDALSTGGSTHGSAGIQTAYALAQRNFIRGGVNRVILATDGDFNVGTTSPSDLIRLVEQAAGQGVFLTVLGYGSGNLNDALLEAMTNRLNGYYAYVDSSAEVRRVMGSQLDGSLVTIAKDVKIQVEFNPAEVGAYRLIGYENRALAAEDFNDDRKDAGDIGAGHSVTALYELIPPGLERDVPSVDPLRYQDRPGIRSSANGETMWVKVRYKNPGASQSRLIEEPAIDKDTPAFAASRDFKFAAAVAMTAILLRGSRYAVIDRHEIRQWYHEGAGSDPERRGFGSMLDQALAVAPE